MKRLAIYTRPGSPLHGALCDAFLLEGGWTVVDGDFYEVLSMDGGYGPGGELTRWWLRQAPTGHA